MTRISTYTWWSPTMNNTHLGLLRDNSILAWAVVKSNMGCGEITMERSLNVGAVWTLEFGEPPNGWFMMEHPSIMENPSIMKIHL